MRAHLPRVGAIPDDADRTRRDRIRDAALISDRIRLRTLLKGRDLLAEWVKRFGGDEDLALDAALQIAERLAREHPTDEQNRLDRIRRALLGDAVSGTEYSEPVGPEEHARLPLPWKGVLKALEHVAAKRTGFRPWKRDV
jgi:hypothetical protein